MPKIFGRDVPNWMLGLGVVCLAGLVYSGFGGDDTPIKSTSKTKAPDKKSAGDSLYTQADMTVARFATFTEPPKDAFLPLVSKPGPGMGAGGVDAAWANGEVGWGYTGYVVVNGKPEALLENASTGDGSYVSAGERWKASTIEKVTADSLILSTNTGPHTVKLGEGSEHKGGKDVVPPVAPANPATALAGPIGNPAAIAQQTDGGALPDMQMNNQGAQSYGRGRRGGRGRGRGGGGYGGGGGDGYGGG